MQRKAIVVGALVVVALLFWAGWHLYGNGYLTREGLAAVAERGGTWAPLLVIAAMVLAVVVGPIPTIPISIASGAVFGGPAGFVYAMLGAMLGAATSFHIARALGLPVMERLFRGHATFCPHCSTRILFWAILGARLMPVVSFAAVSYGAGLTAIRVLPYLLATAIGMAPATILYVAVGASARIDPLIAGIGGVVVVMLLVSLPRMIERHDPFGLHRTMKSTHRDHHG